MTPTAVLERAAHIADVRADAAAPQPAIAAALVEAREIESWAQAQVAGLVRQLSAVDAFPEATIAEASKGSLNSASKTRERADTLADAPALAAALEGGAITAGHIDAVTRGASNLGGAQADELRERADGLAAMAATASVDEFERRIRREVKDIQTETGEDRLTRQQRAVRLSMWTDPEGMFNLRGRFDPETGVRLAAKLDATVEAMFAEKTPDGCPDDPIEKQKFLHAHAVARLIDGTGGSRRRDRTGLVVAIDADAPANGHGDGPNAQWPIPVELPARVLAELVGDADVSPVVVRNGVVLYAPGTLRLGRTTRLANRDQRRALRGMYSTCAIPGCRVHYDRCKIHHVRWWRHGGETDIENLLPVCTKHHSDIHDRGWHIELDRHRRLTLTLPDGTVRSTGPPTIRAA